MRQQSKPLQGYVKTSNMYLGILLALSIGFLVGVLFSSYKTTSFNPVANQMPATGPAANMPLTQEQSERLAALEQATKTTPDNVEAWTQLAHFYFDSGKYAQAIEAYQKSLALDENRPDVWTDLGVMYRRDKKPEKAIESFDKALSINAQHEVAMFNKGVVLMHDLNDPQAALKSWETLVQINPNAKAPNGSPVSTLIEELKKESTPK